MRFRAVKIGQRITQLQDQLSGDVKKLASTENAYRFRVGSYRVLFRLEGKVLAEDMDHLRERIADLEDLRDLKKAVQRNGDKPLIPLAKMKKDLGIS